MRRFYIEPSAVAKSSLTIGGTEAHHIKNVLRLKPGERLKLFDGTGCEYDAVICVMEADTIGLEIQRKIQPDPAAGVQITVAQAFLKEKKLDDLVRKLSELGITTWIPFFSERSIARPNKERLAGRILRWKRIATEAMKQCRRKTLLEVHEAHTFDEILKSSEPYDLKILFWENKAVPFNHDSNLTPHCPVTSIMIMLGPEGGFSDLEIETARQSGFLTAGLGPRILRAETATLAAVTLIQYLFGDMGSGAGEPK